MNHQKNQSEQQHTPDDILTNECEIVPVGKRRDGSPRFWCVRHQADATAKYGLRANECRLASVPTITERQILNLRLSDYPGGVSLWGAVAPVYDTTRMQLERGIHVHARVTPRGTKEMDWTVRAIRLFGDGLDADGVVVSELDAIYYMVSSVFGYPMKEIRCSHCQVLHLDRDWFSVHPHQRHLCAACGRYFRDVEIGIGNPIETVRAACRLPRLATKGAGRRLTIRQADYPGGIQIWGSNPAFLWTSPASEEEGIHVHAFLHDCDKDPVIDETYSEVRIDGIRLNARMVRLFMAQSGLPHLKGRVIAADCPSCGKPKFATGDEAFTPALTHNCDRCGREFSTSGRARKVIPNPLPAVLSRLASTASRQPRVHDMGLLPESRSRSSIRR
jgi:hypothetical protein